jgi:hypothetical protein
MSVRVTFIDGSVVEYPEGAGVSDSPDGVMKFVNNAGGIVVAVLDARSVKSADVVA